MDPGSGVEEYSALDDVAVEARKVGLSEMGLRC
jgi:hypothetical protein